MEAVRWAAAPDLARVRELFGQLVAVTASARSFGRFNSAERRLPASDRLQANLGQLLVATVDDYVTGFALLGVAADDARVGQIQEIYVEPPFRDLGLGELLVDAALEWARHEQCVGIEFSALPGDRAAKNLGERSGFRARQIILYRSLEVD